MKIIRPLILSLFLLTVPMQQSNAGVALVTAVTGGAAAGTIALTGLGTIGGGTLLTYIGAVGNCGDLGECLMPMILGFVIGAILLDEEAGIVQFSELSPTEASKLDISREEMDSYNLELEEANFIFSEVTSELNSTSTVEQSIVSWKSYSDLISPDTYKVMQKIASVKK